MKRVSVLGVWALVVVVLVSLVASAAAAAAPSLNGVYYSATCEPADSYFPMGGYLKRFIKFNGVDWDSRFEYYSDAACNTLDFVLRYNGFANFGVDQSSVGTTANLGLNDAYLQATSVIGANLLNLACSTNAFKVGAPLDAEQLHCPPINVQPLNACSAWHQVAAVVNNQVWLARGLVSV